MPARGQQRPRPHQVRLDRGARVAADRHDPLLVALAEQTHDLVRAVEADEIVDVERHDLRHPRAGRVEQLEQGLVAQPRRLVAVGRREQPLDLVDRERLRKALGLLGRGDIRGGVDRELPLLDEEAGEAADRRQLPRDRRGRQPARGRRSPFVSRGSGGLRPLGRARAGCARRRPRHPESAASGSVTPCTRNCSTNGVRSRRYAATVLAESPRSIDTWRR